MLCDAIWTYHLIKNLKLVIASTSGAEQVRNHCLGLILGVRSSCATKQAMKERSEDDVQG